MLRNDKTPLGKCLGSARLSAPWQQDHIDADHPRRCVLVSLIVVIQEKLLDRSAFLRFARDVADDARGFADPLAALDWLALYEADLIVADFHMPKLDSAAFIRRLRALPGREHVPVLVVTAADDRTQREQALDAGASDFLTGPVDRFEFVTRSRTLLRLNRQHRLLQERCDVSAFQNQTMARTVCERVDSLSQMIDALPAFISAATRDGRVVFTNAMHAAHPKRNVHAPLHGVPAFDEDYRQRSRALDALVFRSGRALPTFEQEVASQDGGRRVLLTTKSPLRDRNGAVDGVLTTSLDITARKELEQHLQHAASHDSLTELPNRSMLQARLNATLERAGLGNRLVALHLLDLDRFRQVNDRLGQMAGDELLRVIADRLRSCIGPADLVARIGADEFAVLQYSVVQVEDAAILAQQILETTTRPAVLSGQTVAVSGSIGISLSSVDTGSAAEMLRHADLAMFQAKEEGGNRLRFFVPDMDRRIERSAGLHRELERALRADELVLHYQPQMNLRTSRVCGVEALLRWNHPVRGLLLPGEFLPVAEEVGLMNEIDEWVLRRACREAVSWSRAGFEEVRVGVNISPARISTDRTLDAIATALRDSGLPPGLLEIELTESDLVADLEGAARALSQLRASGVQVSIDDFGVGYSFLGHVKALPADRIKIDQSFIRNLLSDEDDATIVRAVVAMAHGLRLGVVAEGVETVEQFTQLAVEGCDDVQGYYISRPLPLPALLDHLKSNPLPSD